MPTFSSLHTGRFYDVMAYWDFGTTPKSIKLIAWSRDQEPRQRIREYVDPKYLKPWVTHIQGSTPAIVSALPYIRPFLTDSSNSARPVELLHFSLICYVWEQRRQSHRPAYLDSENRFILLNYRIRACPKALMGKFIDQLQDNSACR